MIIPHFTVITSKFFTGPDNTGLGNVLFQLFTAYGLARTFNLKLNTCQLNVLINILNSMNLDHEKTIFRNLLTSSKMPSEFIILNEHSDFYSLYDKNIIDAIKENLTKNIYLKGYFQSHLYFDKYRSDIIKLIKPDIHSKESIKKKYPHLVDNTIMNVSIHFRLNWGSNLKYNLQYFYDAINFIKQKFSKKKILINVFSDNIIQIKSLFHYKGLPIVYFENNLDYIDLWSMSLCHHNILSNSTLSWWGAYINEYPGKIIIYPNDILRLFKAKIYNNIVCPKRKTQHYKEEWIALNTQNVIYQ